MSHIYSAIVENNFFLANRIHKHIFDIFEASMKENNPAAIKYCLSLFGTCLEDVREPLQVISAKSKVFVKKRPSRLRSFFL